MASTRVRLVATLIISLVLLALEAAAARQLSEAPLTSIQVHTASPRWCVFLLEIKIWDLFNLYVCWLSLVDIYSSVSETDYRT